MILGCANQAGEDNRNLARMAGLLAGLPDSSGGVTLNRLCGSGLDAVAMAARAIRGGELDLIIAGGVESMSRAPFVMPKATAAFDRNAEIYDTTIGWRFVNPKMKAAYGDDTMPRPPRMSREDFQISREDQDAFALRSQEKAAAAQANGRLAAEIVAGRDPAAQGRPDRSSTRTSIRARRRSKRSRKLKPIVRPDGTVTAGNASGVNDGAAAMIIATEEAAKRNGLTPRARVLGAAVAGVPPRIMGIGPAPASEKLLKRLGLTIGDIDVIELNEAFAAQGLAVLRQLGLADDCAACEPERRRDRARPSARHVGRAPRADRDRGIAAERRQAAASRPCASASARASRWRWNGCKSDGVSEVAALDEAAIMAVLDEVPGPRNPGRCRSSTSASCAGSPTTRRGSGSRPTYTGCPATIAIEHCRPRRAGRGRLSTDVAVERVLFPPWTTDWISERGRERLHAYGIAPPSPSAQADLPAMRIDRHRGSQPLRLDPVQGAMALQSCLEPFDRFKCH